MIASILLLSQLPRIWYGGSTHKFGQFLAKLNVPEIVVDVGHVPFVPRLVFDQNNPSFLPPMPSGYYTLESSYGRRLLKGSVFPPTLIPIHNSFETFEWTKLPTQVDVKGTPNSTDIIGGCTLDDLLARGERKLKFPNPIFGKTYCYLNLVNVPPSQFEHLAAEMAEHDIIKSGNEFKLVPRVQKLKLKILRTIDEYVGSGRTPIEKFRRLDLTFLKQLPEASWKELLTNEKARLDIEITNTPFGLECEKIFRELLSLDKQKEDSALQSYFSPERVPGLHMYVMGNFGSVRYFRTKKDGVTTRRIYF